MTDVQENDAGLVPLKLDSVLDPAGPIPNARQLAALFEPVMKAITGAVGGQCEVVFHDLSGKELEHSIIAIENGHVTGREVGGPSTNLGMEVLHDESGEHNAFGYRARTRDGRDLRSSSVYFRDEDGHVIGSLCINVDLTALQQAQGLLGELLPPAEDTQREETFGGDITQVLDDLIERSLTTVGKPVSVMDREDKMAVLGYLDQHGAFAVKRAMDRIAGRLGLSRGSAYKYLELIRTERGHAAE